MKVSERKSRMKIFENKGGTTTYIVPDYMISVIRDFLMYKIGEKAMKKQFVMGNEAIGLGAVRAGVTMVAGYPGTPSTEVLETIAKNNDGTIHVEWSVNEKAALEVAAAASYSGARSLVTMKQVGLNVASDPLMCLAYMGVEGGLVVLVADDPGPISSQTEQDTRRFGEYSKLPVFDPSTPEEAYEMIKDAFEVSEKYHTPVLFRPTTRVCHGCASMELKEKITLNREIVFKKDSSRWVIFPVLARNNHKQIEENLPVLGREFSNYVGNRVEGTGRKGVITGGISYEYVMEALENVDFSKYKVFKVATPHPFPEELVLAFVKDIDSVLAVEELDPVLEDAVVRLCGKHHLGFEVYGKRTGHIAYAGENTTESVKEAVYKYLELELPQQEEQEDNKPALQVRPPVLCAGCPHRASFYAVKRAMQGQRSIFCGDIGCYTLGNAKPLDMVDTCLCMGADITMAQGFYWTNPDTKCFSFIGDSTFFASGITGIVNAVYNQAEITVIILDNSTTAMTGHQPHPGTGMTMMGDIVNKVNITKILEGIGVTKVETVNPLELEKAIDTVKSVSAMPGVKVVIFKYPCIAIEKKKGCMAVNEEKCIHCKKCIKEIGCPAIVLEDGKVKIEPFLCTGCGLCAQICPVQAISEKAD